MLTVWLYRILRVLVVDHVMATQSHSLFPGIIVNFCIWTQFIKLRYLDFDIRLFAYGGRGISLGGEPILPEDQRLAFASVGYRVVGPLRWLDSDYSPVHHL